MRRLLSAPFAVMGAFFWWLADIIYPPELRETMGGPYVYRDDLDDTQPARRWDDTEELPPVWINRSRD